MVFGFTFKGLLSAVVLRDGIDPQIPKYEPLTKIEHAPSVPKSDFEKNIDKTKAALLEDKNFNEGLAKFGESTIELPGKTKFNLPQEKAKLAEYLVNQNAHLVSGQDPPEFGKSPEDAASRIGFRFNKIATEHAPAQ